MFKHDDETISVGEDDKLLQALIKADPDHPVGAKEPEGGSLPTFKAPGLYLPLRGSCADF